jgi:hypothetical protein
MSTRDGACSLEVGQALAAFKEREAAPKKRHMCEGAKGR